MNQNQNEIFSTLYIAFSGGITGSFAQQITNKINDVEVDFDSISSSFINSAYKQAISDHYKKWLRKKIKPNRFNAWKFGLIAGVLVSTTKTFTTILFRNIQKYRKKSNKTTNPNSENTSTISQFFHPKNGSIFLREFLDKLFTDILYTSSYQSFREFHNFNLKPKLLPQNSSIAHRITVDIFLGSLSALEASVISKPFEVLIRQIYRRKKIDFKEIKKKTFSQILKKVPKSAIKVPLYGQAKLMLPQVYEFYIKKIQ
ncbi:c-type lectin protein [Anaeramoeba ignava]|uniref:C-type lectin protein n=1 Tax=Anaeramoeba ignava TaxID=1746090 RepID=A0A9Q0RAW6_ANAIG|nr:c-type lectin protein [Anaeramoeba ignava]